MSKLGLTPLIYAVRFSKDVEVVKVGPNIREGKLRRASMQVLVARGANTEVIAEDGRTPLFSAIAIKEIEMVKVRCERRGSPCP